MSTSVTATSASSDAVETACNRLADALDALESRIVALKQDSSQSQQIAAEGKQLVSKHEALKGTLGALSDENKKLKHGLQDAELEKANQRQHAGGMLSLLDSAIIRLEKVI